MSEVEDKIEKPKRKRLYAKRQPKLDADGKPTNHYINNAEFYKELVEFREKNKDRVAAGLRPIIPNSIGEKLLLICTRLSKRYNFNTYYFRQEMVEDAVLNCINYIWNFDPAKSTSPFSYFTLVAHRAFIRRIGKEKRQSEIKKRFMESMNLEPLSDEMKEDPLARELRDEMNQFFYGAE